MCADKQAYILGERQWLYVKGGHCRFKNEGLEIAQGAFSHRIGDTLGPESSVRRILRMFQNSQKNLELVH